MDNWFFKIVPWFIGIVFILIIGYWITLAVVAYKTINSLDGCTPAVVITNDGHGNQQYTVGCKK